MEEGDCWRQIQEKDSEFTILCLLYLDFYSPYSSCARKLSFSLCHIKMTMGKLKSISLTCSV